MTNTEYRSIRKKLGLTQAGLAKLLGESREIVSMRERHKTPITESAAWAIRGINAHFSEKDLRNDYNQID